MRDKSDKYDTLYIHKIVCFFILMLPVSMQSDIGMPVNIKNACFEREYEIEKSGKDSKVLMIKDGVLFQKEIIENPKLTIVHCYSDRQNETFFAYQSLAEEYKERIKCASLNVRAHSELVSGISNILSIVLTKCRENNSSLFFEKYIASLLQSLIAFQTHQTILKPFFLFFKNGALLLSEKYDFSSPENLKKCILHFVCADNGRKNNSVIAQRTK